MSNLILGLVSENSGRGRCRITLSSVEVLKDPLPSWRSDAKGIKRSSWISHLVSRKPTHQKVCEMLLILLGIANFLTFLGTFAVCGSSWTQSTVKSVSRPSQFCFTALRCPLALTFSGNSLKKTFTARIGVFVSLQVSNFPSRKQLCSHISGAIAHHSYLLNSKMKSSSRTCHHNDPIHGRPSRQEQSIFTNRAVQCILLYHFIAGRSPRSCCTKNCPVLGYDSRHSNSGK